MTQPRPTAATAAPWNTTTPAPRPSARAGRLVGIGWLALVAFPALLSAWAAGMAFSSSGWMGETKDPQYLTGFAALAVTVALLRLPIVKGRRAWRDGSTWWRG